MPTKKPKMLIVMDKSLKSIAEKKAASLKLNVSEYIRKLIRNDNHI